MNDTTPELEFVNLHILPVLPEQLDGVWGLVKEAAAVSMPGLDEEAWQQVYRDVKQGTLLCEFVVAQSAEGNKALALALLQPTRDPYTGEKVLHVLCLYGYRKMTPAQYREAFTHLLRLARGLGVTKISALSDVPVVVELFEVLGGSSTRHLTLEVPADGTHV